MNHAGSGVILTTLEALNLSGRSLATLEADRQVTDFRGAVQTRLSDLFLRHGVLSVAANGFCFLFERSGAPPQSNHC